MEYEELKRVRTLVNGTKRFPDSIKKKNAGLKNDKTG